MKLSHQKNRQPSTAGRLWKEIPPAPAYHNLVNAYREFLNQPEIAQALEEDHIKNTPFRVVKALTEMLNGYKQDPVEILKTSFSKGKYNEMITVGDIGFTSLCAHHMLPFIGKAYFAYIPNKHVVGLSKIPRIIEAFSRRLQFQEQLSDQIVDCFQKTVRPRGCAVLLQATHMCMSIRGVKKEGAWMRTTSLRGIFQTDPSAKAEFLASVNRNGK